MESIDDIIEKYATPQEPPLIILRCDSDEYDIYYAASLGEATYRFDIGGELDVNVTEDQVNYYLRSNYWRQL